MRFYWPLTEVVQNAGTYHGTSRHFLSQPFGPSSMNYLPNIGHNGIDIAAPEGDPIYAAADGWIVEQTAKDTGFGLRICQRIEQDGKFYLLVYGHMQRLENPITFGYNWFDKSRPVQAGQVIGYIDSTGYSTGNHLHFGVYEQLEDNTRLNINNGYGGAIDPLPYMKGEPPVNQTKVVLSKDGKTVYECKPIATDWPNFLKQASVEGIEVPNPIPPSSSL